METVYSYVKISERCPYCNEIQKNVLVSISVFKGGCKITCIDCDKKFKVKSI